MCGDSNQALSHFSLAFAQELRCNEQALKARFN